MGKLYATVVTTLLVTSLWAGIAQAGIITATFNGYENNLKDSATVTTNGGTSTMRTNAGLFNWTNEGTGDVFQTFCIELSQYIQQGQTYNYSLFQASDPSNGLGSVEDYVGRLYTNAFDLIGNVSARAAAFQLALWEIVHETSGVYSLNSGSFQVVSTGNANSELWASSYLNSLDSWTSNYTMNIIRSDTQQDQLIVGGQNGPTPISEPATLGLFGLILLCIGVLSRNRRVSGLS